MESANESRHQVPVLAHIPLPAKFQAYFTGRTLVGRLNNTRMEAIDKVGLDFNPQSAGLTPNITPQFAGSSSKGAAKGRFSWHP